jgi:hypothetical protein
MIFESVQVDLFDTVYGDGHKTMEIKVKGTKGTFIYDDIYGLFENRNNNIKKIIVVDKFKFIKSKGHSLITNSLKYFLVSLIHAIETNTPLKGYCTLEESAYNLECYEQCQIV